MLVIYRVILDVLVQVSEIGDLDREDSSIVKQRDHASHEVVKIVDVGEDIVRHHHLSTPLQVVNTLSFLRVKERGESLDPLGVGDARHIPRGLYAKNPHSHRLQGFQERAVVAAYLDHEVF